MLSWSLVEHQQFRKRNTQPERAHGKLPLSPTHLRWWRKRRRCTEIKQNTDPLTACLTTQVGTAWSRCLAALSTWKKAVVVQTTTVPHGILSDAEVPQTWLGARLGSPVGGLSPYLVEVFRHANLLLQPMSICLLHTEPHERSRLLRQERLGWNYSAFPSRSTQAWHLSSHHSCCLKRRSHGCCQSLRHHSDCLSLFFRWKGDNVTSPQQWLWCLRNLQLLFPQHEARPPERWARQLQSLPAPSSSKPRPLMEKVTGLSSALSRAKRLPFDWSSHSCARESTLSLPSIARTSRVEPIFAHTDTSLVLRAGFSTVLHTNVIVPALESFAKATVLPAPTPPPCSLFVVALASKDNICREIHRQTQMESRP